MIAAAGGTSVFNSRYAAYSSADDALPQMKGHTILLVEDEVFIASELQGALERVGARVVYARRLAQGLRAIEETRFDGAILDVSLAPGVTCVPIADRLRTLGVPFIIHSGDLARNGEVIATLDAPLVVKPAAARDVLRELAVAIGLD